jgi:carboxymethylenebutenolidase
MIAARPLACLALAMACTGHEPSGPGPTEPARERGPVQRVVLTVDDTELALHLPRDVAPPLPAVLLFHSAMGPTDGVRAYADALADHGYAACVLDFYGGRVASDLRAARALRDEANARNPELTRLVLSAYSELASDPRVRARRRFLLGWSYGGAWAKFAAGALPDVSGVVAVYGEAFGDDEARYDLVPAPLLLVGATGDSEPSPERLRTVERELAERGKAVSLVMLDEKHGFMEPAHPNFSRPAADQAWTAIVRFLDGAG